MSDKSYYKSLARSMTFAVILVSFLPLLISALITGYYFHTSYKDKVIAHLEELVAKQKQGIDGFLNARQAEIGVLSEVIPYEQLRDEDALANHLNTLQESRQDVFVDLGLVEEGGVQVAYAGPFKLGRADYKDADWFKQVLRERVFISDVFLGLRGVPHFIVAVKFSSDDKVHVLRSTIDFVAFNELVENTRIGETGRAYIINRAGEFQTRPGVDMAKEVPFLLELINRQTDRTSSFTSSAANVGVTISEAPTTGRQTVFVYAPLKNGDWTLVYQQDARDAFSVIYRVRHLALLVLFLAAVSIAIMANILSRQMVKRIEEADRAKEMMNEQIIEAGRLASVGELAAGIAHEINNPVAIMVEEAGWVSDLMSEEEFKKSENLDEINRALLQIKTQGSRCKEITHKLLSFARKTDPTIKEVDLNDLIVEITALSEQRAKYTNVNIVTDLYPRLPSLAASPSEMQQVLLNLINNAIDASKKKGGRLKITTRVEGDDIILSVADSGCGIPQANLPRLFDPFFTTKPVGRGTGLGLSIVYGIINKMGGEISVSSVVDMGTTFKLRMPAANDERAQPREKRTSV